MVKLSTIALAVASAIPLASAKNCNTGLIYCGFNLKRIGNYQFEIGTALKDNEFPITAHNIDHSVYSCGKTGVGSIELIKICDVCVDGGSGKDDHCKGEHWG